MMATEAPETPRQDEGEAGRPAASTRGRRRRLFPGPIALLLIVLFAVPAIALQIVEFESRVIFDESFRNILTLITGAAAGMILVVWFLFASGYSRATRLPVGLGLVLGIIALGSLLRVDHVTGDMVPTFRWVWTPPRHERIAMLEATGAAVDLGTTTELDFPAFLGPNRNGVVDTITLQDDWNENPPELVWRRTVGPGWSAFAAVNGFAVTMEQRGELELVSCYQLHTGEPLWSQAAEAFHSTVPGGIGPRSTPTIHEGKVYALGATGLLHCLDGTDGSVIWQQNLLELLGIPAEEDLEQIAWGRAASPLILDDKVVVPGGGPSGGPHVTLVALNKETGELIWKGGDRQIGYSSPIVAEIDGVTQIVSVNEATASGHDLDSGARLWEVEWPGNSNADANTSQPHYAYGGLLLTKGYGQGMGRFDVRRQDGDWITTELYHNHRSLRTKFTSPVLREAFAFGLSDGRLECVDIRDGKRQWKGPDYGHGQVLLVRNRLLLLAEDGRLLLIEANPERLRELGSIQALEGTTWNTMCLYGRFLLVRNASEAACYELPVVDRPEMPQGRRPPMLGALGGA
jgi:outer membrane protein assembly factor BamB